MEIAALRMMELQESDTRILSNLILGLNNSSNHWASLVEGPDFLFWLYQQFLVHLSITLGSVFLYLSSPFHRPFFKIRPDQLS